MDLQRLQKVFHTQYPQQDTERERLVLADLMAARCAGEGDKRPSVETPLHALFPQTYVLHIHPALVNGLTCSKGGEAAARETLKRDFIWIESCKPGYVLSAACARAMLDFRAHQGRDANLILLQNHGIFFAANTPQGLEELLEEVLADIGSRLTRKPAPVLEGADESAVRMGDALARLMPEQPVFQYCGGEDIQHFCESRVTAAPLLHPFTPDHIVYCKAFPLYLDRIGDARTQLEAYQSIRGYLPRVLLLRGVGAFCFGSSEKQADTCRDLFLDAVKIAVYAESFGGCLHLEANLTDFIVHWEVESYRAKQLT